MNFHFEIGQGLFYGTPDEGRLISEFEPVFVRKICCQNQFTAETSIKYIIKIRDIYGNYGKETSLKSLHNIDYFELFGCPDCMLSKNDRSLLESKLQHECAEAEPEIIHIYTPGLHHHPDGTPVFVLGNYMISPDGIKVIPCSVQNPFRLRMSPDVSLEADLLAKEAQKYITLFPGVSEIIFYGSLLAVIKPFLAEMHISLDFILTIIGRSGSLKTSMARNFALWLDHTEDQETNFQSGTRTTAVFSSIAAMSGLNFLMDDLHDVYGSQAKDSLKNRLDKLTREICLHPGYANVIITGESIKNMAMFSAYDRMFQVTIPKMSTDDFKNLKHRMNTLSDSLMPRLAVFFLHRLIADYENIQKTIQDYLNNYQPIGFEDPTVRISSHIKFLRLAEYLYRTYICNSSHELSYKTPFENALKENALIQQKALLIKIRCEEDINYIKAFYECLTQKDKYIVVATSMADYVPSTNTCLLDNDRIFITRTALINSLSEYLEIPIKPRTIINELRDAGLLDTDSSASFTKKKKNVRHYVIYYELLRKTYNSLL